MDGWWIRGVLKFKEIAPPGGEMNYTPNHVYQIRLRPLTHRPDPMVSLDRGNLDGDIIRGCNFTFLLVSVI